MVGRDRKRRGAAGWAAFRRWRRGRPFGAGLLVGLGGVVVLAPPYATFRFGDVMIAINTIGGVSSLLIGVLLLVAAGSLWLRPQFRLAAGLAAMVLSLVAVVAANLGGFLVGTLLGVLGAALALAWTDAPRGARSARSTPSAEPRTTPVAALEAGGSTPGAPSASVTPTVEEALAATVVRTAEQSASPPARPTPYPRHARRDQRVPPALLLVGVVSAATALLLAGGAPATPATAEALPWPPWPTKTRSTAPTPAPTASVSPTATSGGRGTSTASTATAVPPPPGSPTTPPAPTPPGSATGTSAPTPSSTPSQPPADQPPLEPRGRAWTLRSAKLVLRSLRYEGVTEVPVNGANTKVMKFTTSGIEIADLVQTGDFGSGRRVVVSAAPGSVSTIRPGPITLYTERLVGTAHLPLLGPTPMDVSGENPGATQLLGVVPLDMTFTDVTALNALLAGGTLHIPGARVAVR
ncbi:DUF6114 domain-containing protein [Streptoalloteichus hindustanus]|uniref:Uncharacterized protein n=1 Tax=Streptoalloteichus hindustanus TaxID=2017 RepID=A0A1M4W561_STRHI|nr:DUF6114 domain-containing protein [Streptoalloteichus hindustanus]SHE76337.1 hypothetical protein SAMN05444320_1011008 [Streptoalloteichus hindustanus]